LPSPYDDLVVLYGHLFRKRKADRRAKELAMTGIRLCEERSDVAICLFRMQFGDLLSMARAWRGRRHNQCQIGTTVKLRTVQQSQLVGGFGFFPLCAFEGLAHLLDWGHVDLFAV